MPASSKVTESNDLQLLHSMSHQDDTMNDTTTLSEEQMSAFEISNDTFASTKLERAKKWGLGFVDLDHNENALESDIDDIDSKIYQILRWCPKPGRVMVTMQSQWLQTLVNNMKQRCNVAQIPMKYGNC